MKTTFRISSALAAWLALTVPAAAQQAANGSVPPATPVTAEKPSDEAKAEEATQESILESWKKGRPIAMQYFRPQDKRGINVFETTKDPGVKFTGFKLDFGAAFTSQVQNLSHDTRAVPNVVNGVNTNQLADIGFGFNNSTANLALHAQLAPGIRVAHTTYLSSRHHN